MTDEELAAIVDEYRHDDRSHMGEVLTALAQARRSTSNDCQPVRLSGCLDGVRADRRQ